MQVLFSKFGFAFTELQLEGDEYLLMKETDIIGIMPRADAIADDIPELKPVGDRVLVQARPLPPPSLMKLKQRTLLLRHRGVIEDSPARVLRTWLWQTPGVC